jgi:oligogalacturonide lyase
VKKQIVGVASTNHTFYKVFKPGILFLLIFWMALTAASTLKAQVVAGTDYSDRADVDNTFDMAGQDVFGQRFASEYLTIKDEVTGVDIIALTTSRHNNSKIYQTHPQWTPDGEYIVFRSSRADGQYYAVSMEKYEIVQITTGGKNSSLHLGWEDNKAYQFRENKLIALDLGRLLDDSENDAVNPDPSHYETELAILPTGIRESGGVGLDTNEDRIFFASRLEDDLSAIYSINFETGETTKHLEVPFRANHLQANPYVSGEIMYCWETGGDAPQRIWYLSVDENGEVTNRPIYKEKPDEWVTHEVFAGPDHIIFNVMAHIDRLRKNPTGVFTLNIRTTEVERFKQAEDGGYWHSDATKDLKWGAADKFDGSLYRLNLETGERTLLTTGHRPNSKGPFTNEAHSHHSISPDGKWLLFNSSMLTESDIMMVPLHPKGLD